MFIGYYDYTVIATYAGLACGTVGIGFAVSGKPFWAIICLILAGVFDMFDGKIARLKKDRSEDEKQFGIQIDSLCDLVSFGVLPAAIAYGVGMTRWYYVLICVIYVAAAQIRLAYFNVDEMKRQARTTKPRSHYRGLPVTSAAAIIPFFYTFAGLGGKGALQLTLSVVMTVTAILFVLNIKIPKPNKLFQYILLGIGSAILVCLIVFKCIGLCV